MPRTRTDVSAHAIAMAACAFAAQSEPAGDGARVLLQLTPAEDFTPSDGRAMDVPTWRMNAAVADRVLAAFNAEQPPVIDYEHQTLHKEANGQPAPAAGFMHGLRWLPGRGLFAVAELTERARQLIAAGEYRYFSPVFEYDRASGDVTRILMGAFTNHPAIAGMQALQLAQAASARLLTQSQPEEPPMSLLEKLLAALGLDATTSEADALTALADRLAAASADAGTGQAAASAAVPDPARYVPVAVVQELQTSVAALTAAARGREVDDLVRPALADGRLLPAQEAWARELGVANVAALSQYLATAQPIAALTGTQTTGAAPGATHPSGLNTAELAVAAACGMTPEQFAQGR